MSEAELQPLEPPFALAGRRVWVAGHGGMVGQALMRRLAREDCELLSVERKSVDLRRQAETEDWMAERRPDAVFLAAARVGGILANDSQPADFIHDNLAILTNVTATAARLGVAKLLLLGSSCIYPREAPQPMTEDCLLTGPLEPTNQWYAIAKIAGLKLCQAYRRQQGCDFISALPTNLYGPGDNFDLETSHVIPALLRKIHEAKAAGAAEVTLWGTGRPRREFLHVDDCADALVHLKQRYSGESHDNVGCGREVTIRELAETIARVVGWDGAFAFDTDKPDGAPRKLLDIGLLSRLGWAPSTGLEEGLRQTYAWYLENLGRLRGA